VTVLVDTSVLVDHLRGDARARETLLAARAAGHDLAASVLTRTELLAGARPAEMPRITALFGVIRWVAVDGAIADRAGEHARTYLASHRSIDLTDYVIAATSEALGAELLTLNVKHFPMFAGLQRPY
jgi:predicted nucleic acid-binding protein